MMRMKNTSKLLTVALLLSSAALNANPAMQCGNATTGHSVWCYEHWYGYKTCNEFDQNGKLVGPGEGVCRAWKGDEVLVSSWD